MRLSSVVFTLFIVALSFSALAQPVFPPGGGGNGPFPIGGGPEPCGFPFEPCPIPLDGGASLLLVAGLAYGGKKLHDRNKSDLTK